MTTIPFHLSVMRLRFVLQADTRLRLPAYAGSSWRGLFGHGLKRSVCVTHQPECSRCLLARQCVYPEVFSSVPPADPETILHKVSAAPKPYVIRPLATSGAQYQPGERMAVELLLFGRAQRHLPYLVHTFQQMGQMGLGRDDGHFTVVGVLQEDAAGEWVPVYVDGALRALPGWELATRVQEDRAFAAVASGVRLRLLTPLRLTVDNRVLKQPARFTARGFLMNLLRRLSLLQVVHECDELVVDYHALGALAAQVTVRAAALRWHDWPRYSNRQQQFVKMGGLLGEVELHGEALAVFGPLLQAGTVCHTGKGTVMGLGQYELDVL